MEVGGEKLDERRFCAGSGALLLGVWQNAYWWRCANAGAGDGFDGLNPGVELLL